VERRLPIRKPNIEPYKVLKYHNDLIGHAPEAQPTNFQYRNPPVAPIMVNNTKR